jgi:osmoprotectant transport system permease protein
LGDAFIEHVAITVSAVGLAAAVALPLALIAARARRLVSPLLAASGVLYTVPALALVTALWPVFGLSRTTVVVAVAIYSVLVIFRNAVVGLVDDRRQVRQAAAAMGYLPRQVLLSVDLPLALPAVISGIRLAMVSSIGLVMIGALVGHGGLGGLVLDGFTNNFYRAPIVAGLILATALALFVDALLIFAERALTPWRRRTA